MVTGGSQLWLRKVPSYGYGRFLAMVMATGVYNHYLFF